MDGKDLGIIAIVILIITAIALVLVSNGQTQNNEKIVSSNGTTDSGVIVAPVSTSRSGSTPEESSSESETSESSESADAGGECADSACDAAI